MVSITEILHYINEQYSHTLIGSIITLILFTLHTFCLCKVIFLKNISNIVISIIRSILDSSKIFNGFNIRLLIIMQGRIFQILISMQESLELMDLHNILQKVMLLEVNYV